MNKSKILCLIFLFALLVSCQEKSSTVGLWEVKLVTVSDQQMTPNARWMRFNPDSTQESGNGWFRHSYGTWSMNSNTNELSVVNTNGLHDPFGPFKVSFEGNTMTWNRIEEGENVTVTLEKTDRLPETFGDKLLGLWQLKDASGNGKYFDLTDGINSTDYVFFRWDRQFVIHSAKGRIQGVYNVHGHKPEVELIPYGENLERDFWQIAFDENAITLKLLNTDSLVTREFVRIYDFPQ